MAVSAVAAAGYPNNVGWNVTATLDADTGPLTITHNFNNVGVFIDLVPVLAAGFTSAWFVNAVTANTIQLTKGTAVGSGNAGVQLLVTIVPYNYQQFIPRTS